MNVNTSNQNTINGNLVIQGEGGELILQNIQFDGMNPTPNGLEMRVRFEGNIQNVRFMRRLEDTIQPIMHTGPVLHKTTGPGDVYRTMNVPEHPYGYAKHPFSESHQMVKEPIPKIVPGRQLFRDLPSPTIRPKQRTPGPYERQEVISPRRLPDFNPMSQWSNNSMESGFNLPGGHQEVENPEQRDGIAGRRNAVPIRLEDDPDNVQSRPKWKVVDLTKLNQEGLTDHQKVMNESGLFYPVHLKNNRVTVYGKVGETIVYENRKGKPYPKSHTKATLEAIKHHDLELYREITGESEEENEPKEKEQKRSQIKSFEIS